MSLFADKSFHDLLVRSSIVVGLPILLSLLIVKHRQRKQLPPGPHGYPFIGNLIELAKALRPHLYFLDLNKKYGNIAHISVFGNSMIVINTVADANELLEKRGAIYSDRPNMVLENEILGWDAAMPTMRYGAQFRKHRRLSQVLLNPTAARGYIQLHTDLAYNLLISLSQKPEQFSDHLLIYATSTIFKLAYDIEIKTEDHDLVRLANNAIRKSAEAYQASGALVDFFPSLKWLYTDLPDWVPFSGFKKATDEIRKGVIKANHIPYEMAKERIKQGIAQPSLVQHAINTFGGLDKVSAEDEHDIMGLAGILYGAGEETTVSTLGSFILAMVRNPELQRRAQEEIDAVVPNDRLPDLNDRPNIPYMEAFLRELFRWAAPLIISIPHASTSEDYYQGFYIPKGASVIANILDMLRACPRAEEFLPERFIDGSNLGDVPEDPKDVVFGFGRRRCPGLHVADNSIWTAVNQMLSVFQFLPEVVDGKEVLPPVEYTIEMTRHVKPFRCRIQLREGRKHLLNKA